MVRDIADKLRLDQSNVSRRLRMAADGGYLRNLDDKRGKPGRWVIGDPLPESIDLLQQRSSGKPLMRAGSGPKTHSPATTAPHLYRCGHRTNSGIGCLALGIGS